MASAEILYLNQSTCLYEVAEKYGVNLYLNHHSTTMTVNNNLEKKNTLIVKVSFIPIKASQNRCKVNL